MAGPDENFLSRWSRRKRADREGVPVEEPPPVAAAAASPAAAAPAPAAEAKPAPLPPVEDLTPESDFTPFMDREVDPGVRQQALKKLFADPRFNVMDMMDVYVDDYSRPDPIPESWMGQIAAMAGLGDVPGRLKAEQEARERAEAAAAGGAAPVEGGAASGPEAAAQEPENVLRDDQGQNETAPDRAGWATPEIPAQKQGD